MSATTYEGWVRHRRFADVDHEFRYPLTMVYVDATEVPGHGLRRDDLLGDPSVPVDTAVCDLVEEDTGSRPHGPVRVLCVPRSLGVAFNPVRFYYAWHEDALHSVVAEVTNTPWGERHAYVLDPSGGRMAKKMHVSPLQPMDQEYAFRLTEPAEHLVVQLENHQDGRRVFDATLNLKRTERAPRRAQAVKNLARIYTQSARLKLKGAPYHPHPRTAR